MQKFKVTRTLVVTVEVEMDAAKALDLFNTHRYTTPLTWQEVLEEEGMEESELFAIAAEYASRTTTAPNSTVTVVSNDADDVEVL